MTKQPSQAPNSRKGRPNGVAKAYGDRDERFSVDVDPEEALRRLVAPVAKPPVD